MKAKTPLLKEAHQAPGIQRADGVLLTSEDVAHYLQFTPETVRTMARRGDLPAIRVGRQWRFLREQIEAWVQARGE